MVAEDYITDQYATKLHNILLTSLQPFTYTIAYLNIVKYYSVQPLRLFDVDNELKVTWSTPLD